MPRIVIAPDPEPLTDAERIDVATEEAFNALIYAAIRLGLKIRRPVGLMYLPNQGFTRGFQLACRAILAELSI